jgi:hypothetical protein
MTNCVAWLMPLLHAITDGLMHDQFLSANWR